MSITLESAPSSVSVPAAPAPGRAPLAGAERATLRLGIVGLGHWGPNHLRVFSGLPGCTVTAVADFDQGRLQRARGQVPAARLHRDHAGLLADPAVDAVVVATPTRTHYAVVKAALEAGKHVLCEKPLCPETAQALELAGLARERGAVLMVGHIFLFNPGILKVKELIDSGTIGLPRFLSAVRTNLGPVRSDVNAALDLASHDISIFNWLLGAEPVEVQAMGGTFLQRGIEDVVVINLRYPRNVLATINCSWLDPKKVRQITLVGSRKMLTWDDLNLANPVTIYDKSVESLPDLSAAPAEALDYGAHLRLSMYEGDVFLPRVAPGEPLKAQAMAFQRSVWEGRAERSDGAFAVGVVRTLAAIAEALSHKGTVPCR